MTTKNYYRHCIALVISALSLYGCSGTAHIMVSAPSLSEESEYLQDRIYSPDEVRRYVSISGIDIFVSPPSRTTHMYDTSIFVPIEVASPPTKPGEWGMGDIGKKPFILSIFLTAEGNRASFEPLSSKLYLGKSNSPIYPTKIFNSGKSAQCGESSSGIVADMKIPVIRGTVPLASKFDVENSRRNLKMYWTCIQLDFDVVTPDPSKKYRLRLGEIITPEGKRIHPTIYFSPVTYRELLR